MTINAHELRTVIDGTTIVLNEETEKLSAVLVGELSDSSPVNVTRSAADSGTSDQSARADHKHDITIGVPAALTPGGSSSSGTGTALVLSNHTHALPDFGDTADTFCEGNDPRLTDTRDPNAHGQSHENGESDEISVTGLSGLLADAQTPLAHKTSHQDGGSDELSVSGLSGKLADAQPVAIAKAGTTTGTRAKLNFIEGSNVTITTSDNGGADRVDVTIAAAAAPGAPTAVNQVGFTATNASYTVPAGFKVIGAWVRPGAGGGQGGDGGGGGGPLANGNFGGTGGGGGAAGSSASLQYAPITALAGHVLNIQIGAGGAGGAGFAGRGPGLFSANTPGANGTQGDPTSITNTTTATLLVRAYNENTSGVNNFGSKNWPEEDSGQDGGTGGTGGNGIAGGNTSTITAPKSKKFGAASGYVANSTGGTGGALSGSRGGGGAGGPGSSALPGDEFLSALAIAVPGTSGSGSGKGGNGAAGGAANSAGAASNGADGENGATGSQGRGGGGGAGGGGGGAGSVPDTVGNGGSGGNGGTGGTGSDGAVILVLAYA